MLTEKRQEEILRLLETAGSATLQELKERLATSESTIRRDLAALERRGKLTRVFGGAVKKDRGLQTRDATMICRREFRTEEKERIGRRAAALVEPGDFIFLDAGTTTGAMISYLTEKSAVFVTNGITHALRLSRQGFRVLLLGGELKDATEAIAGSEAYEALEKYYFTKCFLGTNGAGPETGFTTPDIREAMIKKRALEKTARPYVLCDSSKFFCISPVKFGEFSAAEVITEQLRPESLREYKNILLAE